ncbi:hypothetical protein J6590_015780 [Homalodisca vitripennis]|nr:hypothetical protein J6590_015780 [Homalodisca vitripennis]
MNGTRSRREHLKQCKFFDCECKRCQDPTELGTHVSSLRCECGSGHLVPTEPLSLDSTWRCDNDQCHASLAAAEVDTVVTRIDKEIKSLDHNNVEELEISIRHYSGILHRNHYLILGLKYTLSQLYGKSAGYLIHQMTEAMLERKKQVCEDILQMFDVLEPGLTRTRGLTMYELHAPIMVLTIQRFENHKISKGDLCRSLRRVAAYLRDCCKILKFESDKSQEGSIKKAAQDALVQLKSWEPVVGKML